MINNYIFNKDHIYMNEQTVNNNNKNDNDNLYVYTYIFLLI